MKKFSSIANEIQNVQVYPSTIRIEPNDKVTKFLFNFNAETYEALTSGAKFEVIETKKHKKFGEIVSSFKLKSHITNPLTEFDRAVLGVCISEMSAGNLYTTPAIIYRALTGKIERGSDTKPNKNQLAAIRKSVDTLMLTAYDPDITEAFEQLNYGDGEVKILKSAILPCCRVEVTINGQKAEVVYFDRESPLLKIANLKNQIIRYDTSLLDVPNQNNTPLVITLKNYVIRRVMEIKLHKMTPTLTFSDIFKKCRISDGANRDTKYNARETVINFFENLAEKNVIKSFEIVKKGVSAYGVNFAY